MSNIRIPVRPVAKSKANHLEKSSRLANELNFEREPRRYFLQMHSLCVTVPLFLTEYRDMLFYHQMKLSHATK